MSTNGLLVGVLLLAAVPGQAGGPPTKKVIEWGWDEPNTRFIRDNIERMEKYPFDGLIFHVDSNKGGNLTWEMWGSRRFGAGEFDHAVADLVATKFQRFTDRFLRVNVTPGDVDWFDDQAWKVVAQNFAIAARLAKAGRCKGFMFDVEQYNKSPFSYKSQVHHKSKSFADYQAKVRDRGRQWMRSVNAEFPDITILWTFGYALAHESGRAKDRSGTTYGLLADFLDGMLDACTETTRLVDAWEYSYPYKKPEQFRDAYNTIKEKGRAWSGSAEKYGKHVHAGFGVWMDQDWRGKGWNLEDTSKNYFTPAEFERSVGAALQTSDEYVWIYTEQPRWWTNERLPQAYVDALANAHKTAQRGSAVSK